MEGRSFTGNIFIYHAFDIGDDVNLEKVAQAQVLRILPPTLPKYFKNYQTPLSVELPEPRTTGYLTSKINDFGALSLTYKIPFNNTLENVRASIESINAQYNDYSVADASSVFQLIAPFTKQAKFFHLQTSYTLIQVNYNPHMDTKQFKDTYGTTIASLVRFETDILADYQKQDILDTAIGYYRGDLIIIDSEAAFIYDEEYEHLLNLFEFSNIQHLELMYFDQVLARRLTQFYERKETLVKTRQFIPFIGLPRNPVTDLGRLKVDISVISEQLQNSIKLANEPYLSEIYTLLVDKLDLAGWKKSIDNKLAIITEVSSVYYHRLETIRAEMLEVLVIVLIAIELILGILK